MSVRRKRGPSETSMRIDDAFAAFPSWSYLTAGNIVRNGQTVVARKYSTSLENRPAWRCIVLHCRAL